MPGTCWNLCVLFHPHDNQMNLRRPYMHVTDENTDGQKSNLHNTNFFISFSMSCHRHVLVAHISNPST